MEVHPYLSFPGNCEEALNFYAKCLGGKVENLSRFADSPMEAQVGPENSQKVMHARVRAGGLTIMASDDMRPGANAKSEGNFSLSLAAKSEGEAKRVFEALAEGGSVDMPFADAFWGGKFGMLTDKYGVCWMMSVGGE